MRYLGIDYGTKKTGLALSDEAGTMGFPHAVVPTANVRSMLMKLAQSERVDAVVIGESKNLHGKDNPVAAGARELAVWVARHLAVPVYWESETFTSAEARRQYERHKKSRAPRAHPAVDASAAALILTSYLSKPHE